MLIVLYVIFISWALTFWWMFSVIVADHLDYQPALWMTFFFGLPGLIVAAFIKHYKEKK